MLGLFLRLGQPDAKKIYAIAACHHVSQVECRAFARKIALYCSLAQRRHMKCRSLRWPEAGSVERMEAKAPVSLPSNHHTLPWNSSYLSSCLSVPVVGWHMMTPDWPFAFHEQSWKPTNFFWFPPRNDQNSLPWNPDRSATSCVDSAATTFLDPRCRTCRLSQRLCYLRPSFQKNCDFLPKLPCFHLISVGCGWVPGKTTTEKGVAAGSHGYPWTLWQRNAFLFGLHRKDLHPHSGVDVSFRSNSRKRVHRYSHDFVPFLSETSWNCRENWETCGPNCSIKVDRLTVNIQPFATSPI